MKCGEGNEAEKKGHTVAHVQDPASGRGRDENLVACKDGVVDLKPFLDEHEARPREDRKRYQSLS